MKADERASKVRAMLNRLQLPLEFRIQRGSPLEPMLDCLRVIHASDTQLDDISSAEVRRVHKDDHKLACCNTFMTANASCRAH